MASEYGIITENISESKLIGMINKRLESFFKGDPQFDIYTNYKLKKRKNLGGISLNPDRIPWDYEYQYNFSHKTFGAYIELYPNTDNSGKCKFNIEGVTWNLYITENPLTSSGDPFAYKDISYKDHRTISVLLPYILEGISCETVLIKEYSKNEERL